MERMFRVAFEMYTSREGAQLSMGHYSRRRLCHNTERKATIPEIIAVFMEESPTMGYV
jgi:hypothetical protein